MEDALNTNTWQQANTFMDIIAPRVKNPTVRATPERSQTLMRSAVKKPEPRTAGIDLSAIADTTLSQIQNLQTDLSIAAGLTDRSPLISRFAPDSDYQDQEAADSDVQEATPLEVQPYPSMDEPATLAEPIEELQTASYDATAVALEQPSINIFKQPEPGTFEYSRAPSSPIKWSLAKRISGWSVLAIAVLGVVGGGLFINHNFSKLELDIASSRAGFSATLPSIKPSGYNLSGISTGGGVIEASFKSNVDSRNYSISEKKSSLTSSGLLEGYVTNQAGLNFQTVKTGAKTIYIYNGHNATWVSSGIWYVTQDNNSLSDHQIIDIADSM